MNNPTILFDKDNMLTGSNIVKEVNKEVAKLIGIRQAARTTCTKPSGNASVLLETASGIHGEHAPTYLRHVQMNKDSEVAQLIMEKYPEMVEESVWSTSGTDIVIGFPIVSPQNSHYKSDLLGVKLLEKVKLAQQVWVENGTNVELCTDPTLRHNISNTITVDDWDEVEQYVFDNIKWFTGISFLAASGDKAYVQAPNAEVKSHSQIAEEYGSAGLFASGLIEAALGAFNNDLWAACDAYKYNHKFDDSHKDLLKRDWCRRYKQFADRYLNGNIDLTEACLKDVYYLHKWEKIQKTCGDIDWSNNLSKKKFTDIDTMAAVACHGGVCEI